MRGFFGRLGLVGASLLASAVLFSAIAAGVIVHRLESTPAASSTQGQSNHGDEQGDGPPKQRPAKHPAHPSPQPEDSQDKET